MPADTVQCYFRGKFIPFAEAKVGVMTHALNYGTGVFEGIRAYWNADREQLYLLKMQEHYDRLHRSCRMMRIKLPHDVDELCEITRQLVEMNGYREDVYIRPLAFQDEETITPTAARCPGCAHHLHQPDGGLH